MGAEQARQSRMDRRRLLRGVGGAAAAAGVGALLAGGQSARPAAAQTKPAVGPMITTFFSVTIAAGREEEWQAMVADLHRTTHAEDEGVLAYEFYRRADNPREYMVFEQWRDADALAAHLARLVRVYGEPPPGTRLPAAFVDIFERAEAVRYEPVT